MPFRWLKKRVMIRRRPAGRRRKSPNARHYNEHKEGARVLVHERLVYWNQFYNFEYKRVAIRNQRSRWGSCSTKQNLNFNYRIVFLPMELVDYIVVHELCHLKHFNHSQDFWDTVGEQVSEYNIRKVELRHATQNITEIMRQS